MKTGILTYHDTKNFGSWLQTYALYKKCIDLGADAEVIDYKCPEIVKREVPPKKPNGINPKAWLKDYLFVRPLRETYAAVQEFSKKYLRMSDVLYTPKNISSANENYDTFLVGSDIVWGTHINNHDYTYFLDFVNDDKQKLAFSSSIGEKWESNECQTIKSLLDRFDSVAVREEQSAKWIEEIGCKKPAVVCDPTMLLTAEDWSLFVAERKIQEKYIFVYFMDNDGKIIKDALELGRRLGCAVYFAGYTNKMKGIKSYIVSDPSDFISVIAHAEVVLCASFHGTLFSLYMNKPFYFYYKHSSSRMDNIAKLLGIENRCGSTHDVTDPYGIDYEAVNQKINGMRNRGIKLLSEYMDSQN